MPGRDSITSGTHPRIACIGGGTGLYALLSGLKATIAGAEISAIVAMTDSGGSTGRLRDEFGYLPPGDVRKCLVALSEAPDDLRKLMEHRYRGGKQDSLRGHVVGNLLLTALKEMTGGEYEAIETMERLLRIRGKVYPVTIDDTHLVAHLIDGSTVEGETRIDVPTVERPAIDHLALTRPASIYPRTRNALIDVDAIVIGPGDLYTSILPNLVVDGVAQALADASDRGARIIFIVNTMTKHGETDNYAASAFVKRIQDAIGRARISTIIVNNGRISPQQRRAYAAERAAPVVDDLDRGAAPCAILARDLVGRGAFARHDPARLAAAVRDAIAGMER